MRVVRTPLFTPIFVQKIINSSKKKKTIFQLCFFPQTAVGMWQAEEDGLNTRQCVRAAKNHNRTFLDLLSMI